MSESSTRCLSSASSLRLRSPRRKALSSKAIVLLNQGGWLRRGFCSRRRPPALTPSSCKQAPYGQRTTSSPSLWTSAVVARQHSRDGARADRARRRASRRACRPIRGARPRRDAALAAGAASVGLRRRPHRAGRRAARLGDSVAPGTCPPCAACAARAPVRACDRFARRATPRSKRLRACARAAAVLRRLALVCELVDPRGVGLLVTRASRRG